MEQLKTNYFFDLTQFPHADLFHEISFVWAALSKIHSFLKSKKLGNIEVDIPTGVYLVNPEMISIGKGTVLEPGAYIKGPCIIGENCSIRQGAYIRGDVITGNSCVIGHDTEIKNSIMLNRANAAHFAYVGDSILGNGVNLGAGTKCANLKFDHSSITIRYNEELINTELKKFGAIIGDGTQIGCNAVTNPGTLIGKNGRWYPCTNFGGFVAENQIVRSEARVRISSIK